MHILITGAAGFIGQLLAAELLQEASHTVVLTDISEPPIPHGAKHPENARTVGADLCDAANSVVDKNLDAVFIFHGIMSAASEANFHLGMHVNVDSTRNLLEALRDLKPGVKVIYSSSQAVYGPPFDTIVNESTVPTPLSSYGAQKLMTETLICDYTRRGFISGLILRFPTICVRPGKPTAAASSFLSGMIREPLNGLRCEIPLEDRSFRSMLCSPRNLVANLLHGLYNVRDDALPSHIRQVNLPGICVSIQEMMEALATVAGKDKLSLLSEKHDESLAAILRSWATEMDFSKALKLGFKADESFEEAVRDYARDVGFVNQD